MPKSSDDQVDFKIAFECSQGCFLLILPDPPNFKLIAATDLYLKSLGRTRENLLGQGLFEAFPENPNDKQSKSENTLRTSLNRVTGTRSADSLPILKYDVLKNDTTGGSYEARYWSVTNYPIFGAKNELLYILNKVEDVTDLVRLRERDAQQTNLNEELTERTHRMEVEVLSRAQEVQAANVLLNTLNNELESSNKELEAFSYSVSHDLRAPVRHITSYAELLKESDNSAISAEGCSYLDSIIQSAKRMVKLIDDLLAFSRLGRTAIKKQTLNLSALIKDLIAELSEETKGRTIYWNIQPLPTVSADRALLHAALLNLLSNALKFTIPRAEAKIEIGSESKNKGETVIYIRDNGVGFDPKYSGKLFDVFQRLHSVNEFDGTGIGLANVQRIVHRHGGRVWAESEVEKGATFFFSLPNINEE